MTPRRDPLATGQGPFKPSTSSRRALFGVDKAIRDLQLYLARVDPSCALDDSTESRALLTGVRHVLNSAVKMEQSAIKNLQDLKARPKSGTCVAGTPMHKDPRNAMREQLERSKREAHEAVLVMRAHEQTLSEHCDRMNECILVLQMMASIYGTAVDVSQKNTLTSTASSKGTLASPSRWARRSRGRATSLPPLAAAYRTHLAVPRRSRPLPQPTALSPLTSRAGR